MSGSNIAAAQEDTVAEASTPRGLAAALGWTPLIILTLAAILTACWLLYRNEADEIAARQSQVEVVRAGLLAQLLRAELRPVIQDLRVLADGDGLQNYLLGGRDADLQRAIRRAKFVSAARPEYDQVRYLDETGREIIRVNRGGVPIAASGLQNKANRDYFVQTNGLAPGDLYVSDFDLNIENGQLDSPLKPMLRFAVPVFDAAGRRRGIYIINYLGTGLIENLQRAAATAGHRFRLLNANGYWLKAGRPDEEWGFMLPGREGFTLARSDPALWSRVRDQPAGQMAAAGGLFTWQKLQTAAFADVTHGTLRTDTPYLIVASQISGPEWQALFTGLRRITLAAAAGLMVLALFSIPLLRGRLLAMRSLRAANELLETRVRERTRDLADSNEQLRYREQLLEETGSLAKVGGWDVEVASGAGRWTNEVARIHDVDPAIEPNRQYGIKFYPGESRVRLEAALQAAMTQGTPYDLELQFISASGEHKWVRTIGKPALQDGKVVRLRGALQDVTDRKLSEQRLRTQLQRLHLLEQTTRAIGERQDLASILQVVIRTLEEDLPLDFGCVCLYDSADRALTVAAVGVASLSLAEQLSLTEQARIAIDENGLSRCVRGQLVYEPDIAGSSFAFPQRLAAGGLRAMVAAPLQIESQVFGVLIGARRATGGFSSGDCEFLRQLSEHVALAAHQAQLHGALQAAYEDLRSSQQAVMQQERLRVLGQMASGITHDINNAIAPITLYADSLLANESGLSAHARNALETIQQSVSDVAATVARLREFYRHREIQTELLPVDINKLASQVIELTRTRWQTMPEQNGVVIDLQTELAPDLPPVRGMESEIREALINLVFNAVDAMPAGGTLTLRTRLETPQRVWVKVADTGIGMNEDTRRRCLEPFFTTKGERGTGLGLGMVYGVMQRHGGDIEIESEPGVGTCMRLSFATADGRTAATDAAAFVATGLTILVIDDDPILLKTLREILERDGHTVFTANGGQAGIEQFRARQSGSPRINLVITDLGMPHVDGRRVATAVKQISAETPVILLTGWGERILAEGETPAHVDLVLGKPARLREIRKAVAEVTRYT